MDYEYIKAMVETRIRQWQGQAEKARQGQADQYTIDALETAVTAGTTILHDLETAYDIHQAQLKEKIRYV